MLLGATVSLRDFATLQVPGSEFSELLLLRGDLERVSTDESLVGKLIEADPPILYVHVQEFLVHDGEEVLVDLSSEDVSVRSSSVSVVRETRSLASRMGGLQVVVHPGGIRRETADGHALEDNLVRSLRDLGPSSLLLENMPWYYWFRKRERLMSNVCVTVEEMSRVSDLVEGFTLDTSHGYLSCAEGDDGYCRRFMDALGDRVMHIHASDARAPDHEGLQIDEGDADLSFLREADVPILAEVWNGHADGGRGFRVAIERLRALMG